MIYSTAFNNVKFIFSDVLIGGGGGGVMSKGYKLICEI
jgi:hypothetical protein